MEISEDYQIFFEIFLGFLKGAAIFVSIFWYLGFSSFFPKYQLSREIEFIIACVVGGFTFGIGYSLFYTILEDSLDDETFIRLLLIDFSLTITCLKLLWDYDILIAGNVLSWQVTWFFITLLTPIKGVSFPLKQIMQWSGLISFFLIIVSTYLSYPLFEILRTIEIAKIKVLDLTIGGSGATAIFGAGKRKY